MTTTRRNDLCPCGSGKKYKKCCQSADASALRGEDVLEAYHLLLDMLQVPDMAATSAGFVDELLGDAVGEDDRDLLLELERCEGVQAAVIAHLMVDDDSDSSAAAMYGRTARERGLLGLARAFDHLASRELVLYRAEAKVPTEPIEFVPIDPPGGEVLMERMSDTMGAEPGALAFGRTLHEPTHLGRHMLPFPLDADADAIIALAQRHRLQPDRMRVLFRAWLGAWLPHLRRDGVEPSLGRTLWQLSYRIEDRAAFLAALSKTPGAKRIEFPDEARILGEDENARDFIVHTLRLPSPTGRDIAAEFVLDGEDAHAHAICASDAVLVERHLDQHLGASVTHLGTQSKLDFSDSDPFIRLVRAHTSRAPGIVRVRATLAEITPPIWRELDVPLAASLEELHSCLIDAFGFDDAHLHLFETSLGKFEPPDDEADPNSGDSFKLPVGHALTAVGEELTWNYDFGDGWAVGVEALHIDAEAEPLFALRAGARACPPEDCGGPHGFEELVAAMKNRRHPRRRELMEWLGGEAFDPEEFDLDMHAGWVAELN